MSTLIHITKTELFENVLKPRGISKRRLLVIYSENIIRHFKDGVFRKLYRNDNHVNKLNKREDLSNVQVRVSTFLIVDQKCSATWRHMLNSLLDIWKYDEILSVVFEISLIA